MFGISSYSGFMDKETDLVKVNGKPITAQEVDVAAKRQAERVGGNVQIAQSLQFRQAILNELLQQRILGFAVNNLRLQVGREALVKSLIDKTSKYDENGLTDVDKLVDFCSNDYLGLAKNKTLAEHISAVIAIWQGNPDSVSGACGGLG